MVQTYQGGGWWGGIHIHSAFQLIDSNIVVYEISIYLIVNDIF